MTTPLLALPPDILAYVLSFADACSLLAASKTCVCLDGVLAGEIVWEALLRRQHHQVLEHSLLFDGRVPLPRNGLSWKKHYFDFAKSWKCLAQAQTPGRILLKIHGSASGHDVPHSFGVYDATAYAPLHPGLEFIVEDAAEEEDSTELFAAASHTKQAQTVLRTLAVPGLECLPVATEELQFAALRRSSRRRRSLSRLQRHVLPTLPLVVALAIAFASVRRSSMVQYATQLLHTLAPTPAAPWLVAAIAIGLSLVDFSCEGVAAVALVVLLVALRSGAIGALIGFGRDLLGSPLASCVLACVPTAVALCKRHLRLRRKSAEGRANL